MWGRITGFYREVIALFAVLALLVVIPGIVQFAACGWPCFWGWNSTEQPIAEMVIRWIGMCLQLLGVASSVWGLRTRIIELLWPREDNSDFYAQAYKEMKIQNDDSLEVKIEKMEKNISFFRELVLGSTRVTHMRLVDAIKQNRRDRTRETHYVLMGGVFFVVGIICGTAAMELSQWGVCGP